MNVRIFFRVRERKDVDLILGQGMVAAGWHAHTLNAPGKFLIAAAEHDTPKRAYLVTGQAVEATANHYADFRRPLDAVSEVMPTLSAHLGLVHRLVQLPPAWPPSRRVTHPTC